MVSHTKHRIPQTYSDPAHRIRTRGSSIWVVEDIECYGQWGHCRWHGENEENKRGKSVNMLLTAEISLRQYR